MHDINFLRSHNQTVTISSPFLSIYCSLHFLIERILHSFLLSLSFWIVLILSCRLRNANKYSKPKNSKNTLSYNIPFYNQITYSLRFFYIPLHTSHAKPSAIFFSLLPGHSFVCINRQPDCLTTLPCYIQRFLYFPFKKSYNMSKELYCNRKDRHGMSE
mgnify:CR=1 FL=1